MKIVIIGNGVAGTFAAQNIRNTNEDVDIEIYSEENYNYYTRLKLPEIISEELTIDDLIVFKGNWYKRNRINTHLNKKIDNIDPHNNLITIQDDEKEIPYDRLILATGSVPNIPPIENATKLVGKGLFTLRKIDDAYTIRSYIKENNCQKAIVIGGGLLGLELSRQIKNCNLDTRVIEYFPRLLPKQLDPDCGHMLLNEIENMGISVELDAKTEKILGTDSVKGVQLKNGSVYDADLILIQAGVHPKTNLAKKSNLKVNRGIIVDEHLKTSIEDIFAVGDCIEYNEQTWGIIPACIEQSKIVAASVLGKKEKEYTGTTPKTTLKIVGIDLTSVGVYDPSEELGGGWEILRKADKKNKCYKKIVLKDNKLKGAILFGEKEAQSFVNKNIEAEVDPMKVRQIIGADVYECGCGNKYDEAKEDIDFDDLPEDWHHPNCNCSKTKFKKKELAST
ncbi:MAG: NAD(P)/FAD-dependent oxidoreductase [Candidatus Lokiarchaeota archaeon]|nr:NAD(P)/FAD-dependent oxidoreductase [Candidatus Lokiarchaeota archaeon]MBD3200356.1 NAD(P)/FAD-dependent oxidoreductase [Candidatus Lokiarchaeota archaeon]